jgi:hypothetical protein
MTASSAGCDPFPHDDVSVPRVGDSIAARRFTGADFLALLPTLARPSEAFLSAVDEITHRQAVVERSAWEK